MHVWHQCPVNTVLDTNPLEDHTLFFAQCIHGAPLQESPLMTLALARITVSKVIKKPRFSSPFLLDSKNKYVIRKEIMINNSLVTHVVDICDFEDFLKCLSGTCYVQPREAIIREALNSDLSVFLHVRIAGSTRTFTRSHSQKLALSPNSHF